MKSWTRSGGCAALVAATALTVHWHLSRPLDLPRLPADFAASKEGVAPQQVSTPSARPPAPRPAIGAVEETFEPIAVIPERLEAPPVAAVPGLEPAAEDTAATSAPPGPRPEGIALRMPYADERLSEFAWLLQHAAELRGFAGNAVPPPSAEESEPASLEGPVDVQPAVKPIVRCPYPYPGRE